MPLLPQAPDAEGRYSQARERPSQLHADRGSALLTQSIVAGLFVAAFLVVAVYRQSRERRVSPVGMWISPAILLLLTAAVVALDRLASPLTMTVVALAVVAGVPLGIAQGSHCSIEIDRAARRIVYKSNPAAIAIFLAALGFRFGVKMATGALASPHPLTGLPALASTAALALAVGMVIGVRIHLQRCYRAAILPAA
ncbi:DUF1453 family protein [bacterium]|nr:MAG: DUF1453 family protein [bacterium]